LNDPSKTHQEIYDNDIRHIDLDMSGSIKKEELKSQTKLYRQAYGVVQHASKHG